MMTQTSLSAATPATKGNPRPAASPKWHRSTLNLKRLSCLPRGRSHRPKGLCAVVKAPMSPSNPASQPSRFLRRFLIANDNDNPTRMVVLSDQRESRGLHPQDPPFLIANLELDLNPTTIRINELKFPNRKFSVVCINAPLLRLVILKASDQDARFQGSQRTLHSPQSPPARLKLLIEKPRLRFLVTPTKQDQSKFLIENQSLFRATTHVTLLNPTRPPSDPFTLYARVQNPNELPCYFH